MDVHARVCFGFVRLVSTLDISYHEHDDYPPFRIYPGYFALIHTCESSLDLETGRLISDGFHSSNIWH